MNRIAVRAGARVGAGAAAVVLALMLGGCAKNVDQGVYTPDDVGGIDKVERGVIVSARPVAIQGNKVGVGVGAGSVGGAIGGSMIGQGKASALAAIAGAVIGGVAGMAAEEGITQQKGMEYIIEKDGGKLVTLVQGADSTLAPGQRVLILYGPKRTRVVADNRENPN